MGTGNIVQSGSIHTEYYFMLQPYAEMLIFFHIKLHPITRNYEVKTRFVTKLHKYSDSVEAALAVIFCHSSLQDLSYWMGTVPGMPFSVSPDIFDLSCVLARPLKHIHKVVLKLFLRCLSYRLRVIFLLEDEPSAWSEARFLLRIFLHFFWHSAFLLLAVSQSLLRKTPPQHDAPTTIRFNSHVFV